MAHGFAVSCEMAIRNMSFQLVFFFFALLCTFYHLEPAGFKSNVGSCIETERRALLQLKEDLIDPFGRLSSWIGEDCCNWTRVGCSNQTGNVVMLDLSLNYFDCPLPRGHLPPLSSSPYQFCQLGGTLNPSLLNLTHLNYLDVSSNNFLGAPIPNFIGSIKNLNHLDLHSANFSGTLNPSLLKLTHLNYLDVSANNFLGMPIPNSIGSLKNLKHLDLSSANFSGMVPPNLGNLSNLVYLDLEKGLSNTEDLWVSDLDWLSGLSSLQYLNLAYVNLSKASTTWPQAINMLPSLLELRFTSCQLYDFPQTLPFVNFTSLQKLDLSYNKFSSPLPNWIFNFTDLVELKLGSSNLTGLLPTVPEGNLCNLQVLDLSLNSVEGKLSESLGSVANLDQLDLSKNLLSGPLPKSVGNLSSLGLLDLSFNRLSGTIPEGIGQLWRLFKLSLYGNSFEGGITEVHFQNLTYLTDLSISSTDKSLVFRLREDWIPPFQLNQIAISDCLLGPAFPLWLRTQNKTSDITLSNVGISDNVPDWFWRLIPTIWWLDLSLNQLRGKLPMSLNFSSDPEAWINLGDNYLEGSIPVWSNVINLSLKNNLFSGPIPTSIGHEMSLLQNLDLSGNLLNGSIPPSVNNMTNLNSLDLSSNKLSGTIPRQWLGLQYLMFLDLSQNNLSGNHIPSSMCDLPSLSWLKLSSNNFGGELSTFLKDCKVHFSLDLGGNKFTGSIPESNIVTTESPMALLSLRGNMLTGSIPEKLCQLSNLHILDLALNNLSGSIPRCLGSLPRLKTSDQFYFTTGPSIEEMTFDNHVELVIKGRESEFTKTIPLVNTIDLSCNSLVGVIPEEITNLSTLVSLNFSWNQLTGKIPENLDDLQLLESFDLSHNHLSGPIPPSISKLTFLSHLNLSYNNLSGQIPSSNQLQTIGDPSIYEGNPGLCGPPLPISCSISSDIGDSEDKDDDKSIRLEFYISAVFGFLVAFWAILGTLVINKSIRHAYFRFLDNKTDKLSVLISVNVARLRRKNGMERN
ncbi:hypothetical protein PTKIN_Ptkin17bG0101400 [Pterospermum kingtungense]